MDETKILQTIAGPGDRFDGLEGRFDGLEVKFGDLRGRVGR